MTTENEDGLYVVAVESNGLGPLVLESEGFETVRESAMKRMRTLMGQSGYSRVAVFRLVYEAGNPLLKRDLIDSQSLGQARIG